MRMVNDKIWINSEIIFDIERRTLINKENQECALGENEFRILQLMTTNPNVVINRNEIHHEVWKRRGANVDDSSLTQAISSLRKILGDSPKKPRYIVTEPRVGYKFIGKVSSIEDFEHSSIDPHGEKTQVPTSRRLKTNRFQAVQQKNWYYIIASSLLALTASLVLLDVDNSKATLLYLSKKISLF